jgi:uncharacterized protein (DUF1501 family)
MLNRRTLIKGLSSLAFASLVPADAFATVKTDKRFVFIVLRGGMDGLGAVPAMGDPHYFLMRGELALTDAFDAESPLALDNVFALNPALAPLKPFYTRKELTVIHAVATEYRARSHFEAQDTLEAGGLAARRSGTGWVYRALQPTFGNVRFGISIGNQMPLALAGEPPAASFAPTKLHEVNSGYLERVAAMWDADAALGPELAEGLRAKLLAERALAQGEVVSGAAADTFPEIAGIAGRLLAADDGPRIAVLDMNGFDTHRKQGVETGPLARSLDRLATGIEALATGLGPEWRRTAVVVASEFGRTVRPNGTFGTDHGTGGVVFLAGGAINGGHVVTDWPGLSGRSLFEERDLMPTLDLRAVFKGVLADHLGVSRRTLDDEVFPGSSQVQPMRDLIRAV